MDNIKQYVQENKERFLNELIEELEYVLEQLKEEDDEI